MEKHDELTRWFADLQRAANRKIYVEGEVVSVDEAANTIDVQPFDDEQAKILDAKLSTTATGFVIVPKIGSTATVASEGGGEYHLAQAGEIDKVIMVNEAFKVVMDLESISMQDTTGTTSIKLDTSGVTINNGTLEGVPISANVAVKLATIETFLNVLQAQYANLLTQLSTIYLPPLSATVASLVLPPVPFTPTTPVEIANPRLKQG